MSHAWHTNESRNVLRLIREFNGDVAYVNIHKKVKIR